MHPKMQIMDELIDFIDAVFASKSNQPFGRALFQVFNLGEDVYFKDSDRLKLYKAILDLNQKIDEILEEELTSESRKNIEKLKDFLCSDPSGPWDIPTKKVRFNLDGLRASLAEIRDRWYMG